MKKLRKWLITDLIIVIIAIIYFSYLEVLGETCLIKAIFRVECPTCKMTRAMLCLLSGDINGYINYNFMALPTALVVYGCLHTTGKYNKLFNYIAIVVAIAVLMRYIFNTF
ncbi:MAG: DUF2752 domain-containing protein [Clostridia bacterium]|nr:DUF2752 domain-containing protein [Clostridia bacterium]